MARAWPAARTEKSPRLPTLVRAQRNAGRDTAARDLQSVRPLVRGDCSLGPRPCPWLSCRYHLALDVRIGGALLINHPGRELGQLDDTCALDVADEGAHTLESLVPLLNLTKQRIAQIEQIAFGKLRRRIKGLGGGVN